MKLVLNELGAGEVRREEKMGREWLVAPVTLIRAMNLDKGYVPEDHVRKSAPAWNGIPVTLNHPRNERGQLVSANSPEIAEKTWMGHIFNNTAEGDKNEGEVWIDIANANELGGTAEQVINELDDGNPVSVSSSYFGDRLEPGEYDGEYREQVMGNIRPDHVAILPNKEGRCSIDDGCMAGAPAANSDGDALRVAATDDGETPEDPADESEQLTNDDLPDDVDVSFLSDNWDAFVKSLKSLTSSEPTANESAESDADENTMGDKTQELVKNHGFDEENLPPEDTECFERIYNSITEDEETDDNDDNEQAANEDIDELVEQRVQQAVNEQLGDLDETVEEVLSNNKEQNQKEDLADTIIANSDDWDEDDKETLVDSPKPVLANMAEEAQSSDAAADFRGQLGANASSTDNDASSFPALTANGRAQELEEGE